MQEWETKSRAHIVSLLAMQPDFPRWGQSVRWLKNALDEIKRLREEVDMLEGILLEMQEVRDTPDY